MEQIDVSIIIISWNTREFLYNCLESLYQHTRGIRFEVILVDNASTDGSVEMVKMRFSQVILIEMNKNLGFAAANNYGMTVARGNCVLLLNSDTILLDNAISKTIDFANAHPETGVIGCRILNPDGTFQLSCSMFPSVLNMLLSSTYFYKFFPRSKFFGREHMTWWNGRNAKEVDVIFGCFMLVRRKAIEEVGMLDEQFFMYGEETDWCYRIKQAGWKILFSPNAEIIHIGGASSKRMKPEMVLQLRASILLFLKKHRGRISYWLACLLTTLFFSLRVPYWLVITAFTPSPGSPILQTAKTYILGAFRALRGWRALSFRK